MSFQRAGLAVGEAKRKAETRDGPGHLLVKKEGKATSVGNRHRKLLEAGKNERAEEAAEEAGKNGSRGGCSHQGSDQDQRKGFPG